MKIKNTVNLKELEKFGFEYEPVVQGYYKVYFPKLFGFIPLPHSKNVRGLAIYKNDRVVIIKKKFGFDWLSASDDIFAVQDLIDAGLIEGV